MTMAARGLAKLIEECGELMQVAGKRLAYYDTNEHPDGGPSLALRLQEEIADVIAACEFVAEKDLGVSLYEINVRRMKKLDLFREWDAQEGNNDQAVDAHRLTPRSWAEDLAPGRTNGCSEGSNLS